MEATLNLRHHLYLKPVFCLTIPISTGHTLGYHRCPMAFPSLHLDARRSPSFPPKPLYVVSCQQRPDDTTPASPVPLPDSLVDAMSQSSKKKSFLAKLLGYRKPSLRSLYLAALWGPNMEKQVLEDAEKAYRDSNFLKIARKEFNEGLAKTRIDWEDLRRAARKLEMAGKEAEAIKKLERISKKLGGEDAYEASLLKAEMLIYQNSFPQRKNLLDIEKMLLPDDARPHLLLAVARAVSEGASPEAMASWKNYVKIREIYKIRGENLLGPQTDFGEVSGPPMDCGEVSGPPMVEDHWKVPTKEQFLEIVEYLKREINTA
ncbi:uncharacterized protein [Aristolochia californica]|uniref:uncharacterized protein isoform X1 n=1 Tax=Aristolochia californica TaxID=171875 RepID=UPI0035D7AE39